MRAIVLSQSNLRVDSNIPALGSDCDQHHGDERTEMYCYDSHGQSFEEEL